MKQRCWTLYTIPTLNIIQYSYVSNKIHRGIVSCTTRNSSALKRLFYQLDLVMLNFNIQIFITDIQNSRNQTNTKPVAMHKNLLKVQFNILTKYNAKHNQQNRRVFSRHPHHTNAQFNNPTVQMRAAHDMQLTTLRYKGLLWCTLFTKTQHSGQNFPETSRPFPFVGGHL